MLMTLDFILSSSELYRIADLWDFRITWFLEPNAQFQYEYLY
ncbi:hypothetical protein SAMN04488130_101334 [Flavobacterium urumqiense]|uniref:Uncharacterized protein n=1 Tax=Flavobacterium urumqiense TaxID=935224 RepID=A0A1H5SKC2_9FLAO|nr:hypothetical protein SAMN04488130_101334 [Flavobacterium urumqiense]